MHILCVIALGLDKTVMVWVTLFAFLNKNQSQLVSDAISSSEADSNICSPSLHAS